VAVGIVGSRFGMLEMGSVCMRAMNILQMFMG